MRGDRAQGAQLVGKRIGLTPMLLAARVGVNAAMSMVANTIASSQIHPARVTSAATRRWGREFGFEDGCAN